MGSSKGLNKKLNPRSLVLIVNKGDKPLTSYQIREYFARARAVRFPKQKIQEQQIEE